MIQVSSGMNWGGAGQNVGEKRPGKEMGLTRWQIRLTATLSLYVTLTGTHCGAQGEGKRGQKVPQTPGNTPASSTLGARITGSAPP